MNTLDKSIAKSSQSLRLRQRDCAGFSLLEILIALSVLSGGLVFTLRASHGVLDALTRSRGSMYATLLAREQTDRTAWAARAVGGSRPIPGGGRFAMPYDRYEWSQTVDQTATVWPDTDAGARLWLLTTSISRRDGLLIHSAAAVIFDGKQATDF